MLKAYFFCGGGGCDWEGAGGSKIALSFRYRSHDGSLLTSLHLVSVDVREESKTTEGTSAPCPNGLLWRRQSLLLTEDEQGVADKTGRRNVWSRHANSSSLSGALGLGVRGLDRAEFIQVSCCAWRLLGPFQHNSINEI